MLAGIVENPTQYNPLGTASDVSATWARRNVVRARMAQLHIISAATAEAAGNKPLGLHPSEPQSGCTSKSAKYAAYMCDYVVAVIRHDTAYKQVWNRLNGIGGLTITTTLDPRDQLAANHAVKYVLPAPPSPVNPGRNADTEVLIQPGTGKVRAIGIDRPYGTGRHQNTVNYAVGPQYNGRPGRANRIDGQGLRHGDRAVAGHTVRLRRRRCLPTQVSGYRTARASRWASYCPTANWDGRYTNDESEPGGASALHRDDRIDQRILRLPGTEGRLVRRG
jgi:membrane peptidoglycan carboxypeptidase